MNFKDRRRQAAPWPGPAGAALPSPPDRDPVLVKAVEYEQWCAQYEALQDERIQVDDARRLHDVLTVLKDNMDRARHRLEHTAPTSAAGLVLLIEHVLSITTDPSVTAVMHSCLAALSPDGDGDGEAEAEAEAEASDGSDHWGGTLDDVAVWGLGE